MENTLVRITITDHDQTVSFLSNRETLLRLVAGCSVNPASLEELLIATDIYQRGTAATLMADLMEFDKALRMKGADFIHAAIAQARTREEPLALAFQVIDDITTEEAFIMRGCDLVVIDLAQQVIQPSAGIVITSEGEINVDTDKKLIKPTVTYILPQEWTVQAL